MGRRGELGEQETTGKGGVYAGGERMEMGVGGEITGKAPLPQSSWRESGKLETAAGTKLKREKGERRGFKFQ